LIWVETGAHSGQSKIIASESQFMQTILNPGGRESGAGMGCDALLRGIGLPFKQSRRAEYDAGGFAMLGPDTKISGCDHAIVFARRHNETRALS
jgi:hypothetical protein